MPPEFTPEQILALAPDAGVAQSGRGLANLSKWQQLGQQEIAAWGECQGSGKTPYRVQIDLREPAFRCTCPSRKFPCKHGVALLLLLATKPASFPASESPAWVSEWLAKRAQTHHKNEQAESKAVPENKQRAASQAKRAATREASVAAGLDDLAQWLHDLLRQGLATVPSRGPSAWEAMAARMVDAQAPGVAGMLRAMAGISASGENWQARLLEQIARLHLLIQGYQQREQLPPPLLASVRARIGWAQDQESVRAGTRLRDRWLVAGQTLEEEDHLRVQRTWLWALEAQRSALLLTFAAPGQQLERSLVVGSTLDAELAYFDNAFPLRALIIEHQATHTGTPVCGYATFDDALGAYTGALGQDPWIDLFPLPLCEVTPLRVGERWFLRDRENCVLPLAAQGVQGWRLAAISGGQPLGVCGTWDGVALTLLSAWTEGQLVSIEP